MSDSQQTEEIFPCMTRKPGEFWDPFPPPPEEGCDHEWRCESSTVDHTTAICSVCGRQIAYARMTVTISSSPPD